VERQRAGARVPPVYLIGSARSVEAKRPRGDTALTLPEVGRWSAGVLWALPWDQAWNVRAERIEIPETRDHLWMVTLRGEYRTLIPARLAPRLGDRGKGGLALPEIADTGPTRSPRGGARPSPERYFRLRSA